MPEIETISVQEIVADEPDKVWQEILLAQQKLSELESLQFEVESDYSWFALAGSAFMVLCFGALFAFFNRHVASTSQIIAVSALFIGMFALSVTFAQLLSLQRELKRAKRLHAVLMKAVSEASSAIRTFN